MKTFALVLILTLSGLNSFAVDTTRCPGAIALTATVDKVNNGSIYEKVPGWKEAQDNLRPVSQFDTYFRLKSKSQTACIYSSSDKVSAVLTTTEFADPEEERTIKNDVFIINLKIANSSYVAFVPVKSYQRSGIALFNQPYRLKIKTRLYNPQQQQWHSYDLGMISVKSLQP